MDVYLDKVRSGRREDAGGKSYVSLHFRSLISEAQFSLLANIFVQELRYVSCNE